jgi:hypothetical protein
MSIYSGSRALDAEIVLDLSKGEVTMNYSLNRFGIIFDSNRSVVTDSEFIKMPMKQRIKWALYMSAMDLLAPVMALYMIYGSLFMNSKYVKDPNAQYDYQKIIKWYYGQVRGIAEQKREGRLFEQQLKFELPNNMWLSYEMTGEYQEKAKKISFLRNMVTQYKFGKFRRLKQDGWNFIVEFEEPPAHGSCIVKYIA